MHSILYRYPDFRKPHRSLVDLDVPTAQLREEFPDILDAIAFETTISRGDAIYIPGMYYALSFLYSSLLTDSALAFWWYDLTAASRAVIVSYPFEPLLHRMSEVFDWFEEGLHETEER